MRRHTHNNWQARSNTGSCGDQHDLVEERRHAKDTGGRNATSPNPRGRVLDRATGPVTSPRDNDAETRLVRLSHCSERVPLPHGVISDADSPAGRRRAKVKVQPDRVLRQGLDNDVDLAQADPRHRDGQRGQSDQPDRGASQQLAAQRDARGREGGGGDDDVRPDEGEGCPAREAVGPLELVVELGADRRVRHDEDDVEQEQDCEGEPDGRAVDVVLLAALDKVDGRLHGEDDPPQGGRHRSARVDAAHVVAAGKVAADPERRGCRAAGREPEDEVDDVFLTEEHRREKVRRNGCGEVVDREALARGVDEHDDEGDEVDAENDKEQLPVCRQGLVAEPSLAVETILGWQLQLFLVDALHFRDGPALEALFHCLGLVQSHSCLLGVDRGWWRREILDRLGDLGFVGSAEFFERPLVDLAAGGHRHTRHVDKLGGQGIVVKASRHVSLQRDLIKYGSGTVETPEQLTNLDGSRFLDSREGLHGSRDTVELHAESLDLDLIVLAAKGLELAVSEPAAQVTCVEHHAAVTRELVRSISLRCEIWQVDVSSGNAESSNPHQTDLSDPHGIQRVVQDVHVRVWNWLSDCELCARLVELGSVQDCDLSRTTDVVKVDMRRPINTRK